MAEVIEIREARECRARPREVWKFLFGPVRFATRWPGWDRVDPSPGDTVTRYDARWPDFAYPTTVKTDTTGGRVVISCLVSDIVHTWTIEPSDPGCRLSVVLTIPAEESARAEEQGAIVRQAIDSLVARAEEAGSGA